MRAPKLATVLLALAALSACSKHHDKPATTTTTDSTITVNTSGDTLNWKAVSSGTTNFLSDIWFTDTLNGFAVCATNKPILHTTDGGKTWNPIATGSGNYYNIVFPDKQHGYAVGVSGVTKTTDGGATWASASASVSVNTNWTATQFLDANTGYIANGAKVLKTTDGGTTWNTVSSEPGAALYFTDANNGQLFYSPGGIQQTADGGTSWTSAGTLPDQTTYAAGTFAVMQYSSSKNGWLVVLDGLYTTTDGGVTWINNYTPAKNDYCEDMQLLSDSVGYLALGNQILRTADGGKTWTKDGVYNAGGPAIMAIHLLDDRHGWAACADGRILRLQR